MAGIYDRYQLANSNLIREYQGSVIPELTYVNQQMQDRYDKAADAQDYMSQYINGLGSLDRDRKEFNEWSGSVRGRLGAIANRPDLENTLRETSMLARGLPQEYSAFGTRMQQFAARQKELSDRVNKGDITPETANRLLARDMYFDKGVTKNPNTGRYEGKFVGANFTNDINMAEEVDKMVKDAHPVSQGYSVEQIGNEWLVKRGGKTVKLTPERINEIVQRGMANNPQVGAWIRQQQDLGTFDYDIDPAAINMNLNMGSRKDGKKDIPITLKDVLRNYTDKGATVSQALRQYKRDTIAKSIVDNAVGYGVSKYMRNDVETSLDYSANPYEVQRQGKKEDDIVIPIAASVLQPTAQSKFDTPESLTTGRKAQGEVSRQAAEQYLTWRKNNKVDRIIDANGNPASSFDPNARFFSGNREVTSDARKMIGLMTQSAQVEKELKNKEESAKARANFKITPALEASAQKAYQEAYDAVKPMSSTPGSPAIPVTTRDREQAGQEAYDRTMANTPGYKRYKQILSEDSKGDSVPVYVSTFKSKKLNDAVENAFNNLNVNLDVDGLYSGANGMSWVGGEKANQPLAADDYEKVRGEGKFAGMFIDSDGQYKMMFKVGTSKTNGKGEVVGESTLVKMPAYTGIVSNMIKEGQTTPAQQFLAQAIGAITPDKGAVRLPVGDGMRISVRAAQPSERSRAGVSPMTNYIITYFDPAGNSKDITVDGIDAAADNIQRNISNNVKR